MTDYINPSLFGFKVNTIIEKLDKSHFAVVIDRKSRIIMKDGEKIVEKAVEIRAALPETKVSLKTSVPVCSKTVRLLTDYSIDVLPFQENDK